MNSPLWIDTHRPELTDLPQENAREYLIDATESQLNLMIHGPRGVGKTAAVKAYANRSHDDPDNDVMWINAVDFFSMSKKELSEDPRFGGFIDAARRRNSSKAALMNHVLKELASHPPVAGSYKTLIIDNAEGMREDFQHALRRVMERHHQTTQYVIITRSTSSIIPAIQSRCVPVPIDSPTPENTTTILQKIANVENVDYTTQGLQAINDATNGNLREAILTLQTINEQTDTVTPESVNEHVDSIGIMSDIDDVFEAVDNRDIDKARSLINSFLIEEGLTGEELLRNIVTRAHSYYPTDKCVPIVADAGVVDQQLRTGQNDRIHLTNFLSTISNHA